MRNRTLTAGTLILVALVAFELLLHLFLDFNNALSITLREWYLMVGNLEFRKAPIAPLVDLFLPSLAVGIVFGIAGKPKSLGSVWLFAMATGVLLGGLQMCYPHIVKYDLWWLAPRLGNPSRIVLSDTLFGGMYSGIAAFCYYDQWRKAQKITSDPSVSAKLGPAPRGEINPAKPASEEK